MRLFCLSLLFELLLTLPLCAADSSDGVVVPARMLAQVSKAKEKLPPNDKVLAINAQQEESAKTFVRDNHPELANLLNNLKESRPKEYQKAMRDLTRVSERLATMKANNAERYELELAVWKSESRIQLLAARLQMSESKDLREQLRQAIGERFDLKLAVLKFERDMYRDRAERADAQLQKLDQQRSDMVEKQLQVITRPPAATNVKSPSKPDKKTNKPAAKDSTTKEVKPTAKKP